MPLHMTKIAYRATSLADMQEWFAGDDAEKRLRTRYLPKRHEEMKGGSLYWIFQHVIVARSPITGFEERSDGHWDIVMENRLIHVQPTPKRAHQGWRYMAQDKAPDDLAEGEDPGDAIPGKMLRKLTRLGLV